MPSLLQDAFAELAFRDITVIVERYENTYSINKLFPERK
jgi:hypothetical protein